MLGEKGVEIRMKVAIFFPRSNTRSSGNRITANRWAAILEQLGHQVRVADEYDGENLDFAICLHVFKTAEIVARLKQEQPTTRVAVAITGTDMYGNEETKLAVSEKLSTVDNVICLNPSTHAELPAELQKKSVVLLQSAELSTNSKAKDSDAFTVIVSGHLRDEKDPLRTAAAARLLPQSSKIQIRHFGGSLDPKLARRAREEMSENSRYHWFEEVGHDEVLAELRGADLLVQSSRVEGAPAVVSEAIVAELPLIISRIPGLVGLLGEDYPAIFEVEDTKELSALLLRSETDVQWYTSLKDHLLRLKPRFERTAEVNAWRSFIG